MLKNLKNINKALDSTTLGGSIKNDIDTSSELELSLILPNPYQPRFSEEVEDLKASILESGLLSPIPVAFIDGKYFIIGGHRRYKACSELGHTTIKCNIIEGIGDKTLQTLAIVENLQREDLHPLELAIAVDNALNNGFTRAELLKALGKSESFISKCLGVLKLSPLILDDMQKNKRKIGLEILFELRGLKDESLQWELYQRYIVGNLTKEMIRYHKDKQNKKNTFKIIESNDKAISMKFDWRFMDSKYRKNFEEELQGLINRYSLMREM